MNNPKPNYPPLRYLSPLHRASRRIGDHLHAQFAESGLTGTEGHIVSYLGSYAPVPVGDLVRVFGLKKSTVTGLLDRLETAGLVRRSINPDDRRSFLVELSPRGEKAAADIRRKLEEFEVALDNELSGSDQQAFKRITTAIDRVTENANPDKGPNK